MSFPNDITRVSVSTGGTEGNADSNYASISADGRYVTFTSASNNLVAGDTNNTTDVFVHDLQTDTTTRISAASGGTEGNGASYRSSISADGRYVTYMSLADNLVADDDNGVPDVFVHDRQTDATTNISLLAGHTGSNGASSDPIISDDGNFITFQSISDHLVPGDNGYMDVFVYDRQAGTTTRVSLAHDGGEADDSSWSSDISADGRYVQFRSRASNLVSDDTNGTDDTFVHDRQTGITSRVSVANDGTQGNGISMNAALSADGHHVAFVSFANNFVEGDTNYSYDVFVRDLEAGTTRRVSVATDGSEVTGGYGNISISGDGRYVAYATYAADLVEGDTNGTTDVFVHDTLTGSSRRISLASDGAQGNEYSAEPAISADGRYIAFYSAADNLVPGDTNAATDIFRMPNPVFSDDGNNALTGYDGYDRLDGLAGNDTLRGYDGDDLLLGRAGADLLSGNAGDDRLYGGADNDKLYGGTGDDSLNGGSGNDLLDGGLGNDLLRGDDGNDNLQGSNGNDTLSGGDGDDILRGGRDDDRMFGGNDTDVLAGNSGDDLLRGGAGDDKLYGGTGADNLNGDAGNDRIDGGYHNDVLRGGDGDDLLLGRAGDDILSGGDGVDRFYGGSGDDKLYGGTGDDNLKGGSDADRLTGGLGDDSLTGDSGADEFVFETIVGTDRVQDFEDGIDLVRFAGEFADLTITAAGTDVDITSVDGGHMLLLSTDLADITEADFVFI